MKFWLDDVRASLGAALFAVIAVGFCAISARADDLSDAEAAYRDGRYATALELFKPLADAGSTDAMIRLAQLYSGKEGVAPDHAKAFALYRQLAKQGVPAGERGLGTKYYTGFGTPKDLGLAAHWFSLAAAHGDSFAQMILGTMYMKGEGVPVDEQKGIKWIRTAADAGDTTAQYLLGTFSEHGVGTTANLVEALKWYLIADQNKFGFEERPTVALARQRILTLSMIMTPDGVTKAKELAKDWKPHSADDTF